MAHFILNVEELSGKRIAKIEKIHTTLAAVTFEDEDSCVVSLKREEFVDYARETGGLVTRLARSEEPIVELTNDLKVELAIVADAYQSYQHTHAHLMQKAILEATERIVKEVELLRQEVAKLKAVEV